MTPTRSTSTMAVMAGLALALGATRAAAQDTPFSAGSLIIPMQSNFQSPCGVLSSYGLVWTLLRENDPDSTPAGFFTTTGHHPVTIYEIVRTSKDSPNRCVPTNLHTPPAPNTGANDGSLSTSPWNDGCDFSITGTATVPPVVPVPSGAPYPLVAPSTFASFSAANKVPMFDLTAAAADGIALPEYDAAATGYTTPLKLTTIRYMGSPFIINSKDAPEVLEFLHSKIGNYDFDKFTIRDSTAETACLNYANLRDQTAVAAPTSVTVPSYLLTSGKGPINQIYHFVQMHSVQVDFSAPVARRVTVTPPKIALLNAKDSTTSGSVSSTLDPYLRSAGLFFQGGTYATSHTESAGCPLDSQSTCNNNGSTSSVKYPGVIYDEFTTNIDFVSAQYAGTDYPYGLLNATDASGQPRYVVFWAPHWDLGNSTLSTTASSGTILYKAPTGFTGQQQDNVMNNIAYFASQKGGGIMLECASIKAIENQSASPPRFFTTTGVTASSGQKVIDARNCGDPDFVTAGRPAPCSSYTENGNLFGQIGDFRFHRVNGTVASWQPATTLGTNNHTLVVRYGGSGDNSSDIINGIDTSQTWQLVNTGKYQGNDNMGSIVYVGGHDYSGGTQGDNGNLQISGSRLVLNTLLNLTADPIPSERAIAAPVSYVDPNQSNKALVFSPTYDGFTGLDPSSLTYVTDSTHTGQAARDWRFPLNTGHLWVKDLAGASAGSLSSGVTNFGDNTLGASVLWEANAKLPAPGSRNIFTYLGGQFVDSSFSSSDKAALIGSRPLVHGVLQGGWVPEAFDYTKIQAPCSSAVSGCVDVLGWDTDKKGKKERSLVYAPSGDGYCDLQQLLNWSNLNAGADYGKDCNAHNAKELKQDVPSTQALVQRVRGFCYAKDSSGALIPQPLKSQCDPNGVDRSNKAHLGGLVHGSPAVIGPSPNIGDAPSGKQRPTVAYVGGLDGQLHAFYVSGGSGYTGPATAINLPSPTANTKFKTDYSSSAFSPPVAGTELWSFIPATQLPLLDTNDAKVDSSPVVQDVFVDLTGSGRREWHTVLVSAIGPTGREVFALDVTNPLKPAMLWDLLGSTPDNGKAAQWNAIDPADEKSGGSAYPFLWDQDTTDYTYASAPQTLPYDLKKLGGASGLSLAQLRAGLAPIYSVFISSNYGLTGSTGMQVYAVDVATGQKVWEWNHTYDLAPFNGSNNVASNSVPPVGAVYDFDANDKRLYVGDMEGRIWELDAATGINKNVNSSVTPNGLPAFDDGSLTATKQPITTNIAIARVPPTVTATTDFDGYQNAVVAVFGTAGADWVPDSSPGKVHVALLDSRYRVPFAMGGKHLDGSTWTQANALSFASGHDSGGNPRGVLQEMPNYPKVFAPVSGVAERIFGNIAVAGGSVFFNTANGSMPSDINTMPDNGGGGSYQIAMGNTTAPFAFAGTGARYGGTSVVTDSGGNIYVVSDEVTALSVTQLTTTAEKAPVQNDATLATSRSGSGMLYKLIAWFQRILP